jgi:hypothetical protein
LFRLNLGYYFSQVDRINTSERINKEKGKLHQLSESESMIIQYDKAAATASGSACQDGGRGNILSVMGV